MSDFDQNNSPGMMDIRIMMGTEFGESLHLENPLNNDEWRSYYEEQSTDCLLFFLNTYWKTNWIVVEILKERGVDSKSWEEVIQNQKDTKSRLELMSTDELSDHILNMKEIGMAYEILEERGVDKKKLNNLVTRGVADYQGVPTWSSTKRLLYTIIVVLTILVLVAIYVISRIIHIDWDEIIGFVGLCVFVGWLFFYFPTIKKNE